MLSTFHPIMHDFAVMLACVRLSNTTDIAKRKQQKRKKETYSMGKGVMPGKNIYTFFALLFTD